MEDVNSEKIVLKTWILRTMYGWGLGFVVVVFLAMISDALGIEDSQFFVGTGMAAGVGFMQARLLKSRLGWSWRWMWTCIIGMTASFLLLDTGASFWEGLPKFNLQYSVILGAVFIGILQYRFLKGKSIKTPILVDTFLYSGLDRCYFGGRNG